LEERWEKSIFHPVYGRKRNSVVETALCECTHCGSRMSSTPAADGGAYYACPRCARTYSSAYPEVIRRAAGARRPASEASTRRDEGFAEVKARLEAWLRRLDEQDPYFVLGVKPGASLDEVRSRYRELALEHHPDRGGEANQMRRILRAYDQIRVLLATGRAPDGAPKRIAAALGELDMPAAAPTPSGRGPR
jgi:hypothetical protein